MVKTPIEKEIIASTKLFAESNNIHFDEATEGMILNALREMDSKSKFEQQLIVHYEDYIKLLGDEINELVSIASVHGFWHSSRVAQGLILREKIASIRDNVLIKYLQQPTKPEIK